MPSSSSLAPLDALRNRQFKLAFFDLDGTLVGPDGQVSTRVAQALRKVQVEGLITAIATGRPPFACRHLIDELQLIHPGLFHAGAALYDPGNKRYLMSLPLPDSLLHDFLRAVEKADIYCEVYLEDGYVVAAKSEIQQAHSRCLRVEPRVGSLWQAIAQGPVFKFLVGLDQRARAGELQQLERGFPQLHFAYARMASHPEWLFASVIHGEVDKRHAFAYLCQHYGVGAEEVVAFGDAESDQAFLRCAGLGVAMANAPASVRAVADFTTKSVSEDGVAEVLDVLRVAAR